MGPLRDTSSCPPAAHPRQVSAQSTTKDPVTLCNFYTKEVLAQLLATEAKLVALLAQAPTGRLSLEALTGNTGVGAVDLRLPLPRSLLAVAIAGRWAG